MGIGVTIFMMAIMLATAFSISYFPIQNTPNSLFGIAIPPSGLNSPEAKALLRTYRRNLLRWSALFLVLAIPVVCTGRWFLVQFPLLLIWFFAVSWRYWRCYDNAAKKAGALRQEKGWETPSENSLTVDLSVSQIRGKMAISPVWMLPGTVLSLLPLLWVAAHPKTSLLPAAAAALLIEGVFWLSRHMVIRGRSIAVSENPDINRAYHYASVQGWTRYIAVFSSLTQIALLLLFAASADIVPYRFWASFAVLLLLAGILVCSLAAYLRICGKQKRILEKAPRAIPQGDTASCWKAGFYNNPLDPRIMVPKRAGIGYTFNVGNPAGKILAAVIVGGVGLLIAGLFGVLIWAEVSPFHLSVEEGQITVSAPLYGKKFPLSELESVSLAGSIPGGVRTNGIGTSDLLLGNFRLDGAGEAILYVRPDEMPCLVLHFGDYHVYFTGRTPEETQALYEQCKALLP